jgi:hypothetical protein
LILILSLLTVACGDDDAAMTIAASETTAAPATTAAPEQAMPAPGDAEGAGREDAAAPGSEANAQAAVASLQPADHGRSIVYTATIEVEVDDVVAAGQQVQVAIAGLGGMLFGQETTTGDNPRSVLTIKVLPENFHEALQRLSGIGELLSQTIYADDVTERVVDLQSRITTAAASVERLRGFLEDATDLETVATLEAELLNRETELELLRGQLRTLEDQVALATIVVVLTEPTPPVPKPALELIQTGYVGHDDGARCPGADDLRVDEGDDITVCFEVFNTGDTLLTDIEVRDTGLKADEDDLFFVDGDLETPLQPGERVILAFEASANPRRSTHPAVQAAAVDADGDPIRREIETEVESLKLRVIEDDSLPGFVDALKKAWRALQRLFGIVTIFAGALVPWLWVPVLVIGAIWYMRRRQAAATSPQEPPEGPETSAPEAPEPEPPEDR